MINRSSIMGLFEIARNMAVMVCGNAIHGDYPAEQARCIHNEHYDSCGILLSSL